MKSIWFFTEIGVNIINIKCNQVFIIKNMDKKIVIYTAISSNYNVLLSPSVTSKSFKYICFTDNYYIEKITNNTVWEIRPFPKHILKLDPTRKNRYIKTHPHILFPDYDISVYIDGNIDILSDISNIIDTNKIKCLKHSVRNCIYTEGKECIKQKKAPEELIKSQLDKYREEGYPSDNGLIEGNIIVRAHKNPDVIKLMELWWNEILTKSGRDQLSFPYACWKSGVNYELLKNQNPRATDNTSCFEIRKNIRHIKKKTNYFYYIKRWYHMNIGWRF